MRSARLRFPPSISLLVKRATFLLLYFASGTSGRRTALLRLGNLLPPRVFKEFAPLFGSFSRHQKRRRCDREARSQSHSDALTRSFAVFPFRCTLTCISSARAPGQRHIITHNGTGHAPP